MCAAIRSADRQRRAELQRPDQLAARRPRRPSAPTRAGTRAAPRGTPPAVRPATRSARTPAAATATPACTSAHRRSSARASAARHARHPGGATTASNSRTRAHASCSAPAAATSPARPAGSGMRHGSSCARRVHGSARDRHNSAQCSCRICSEPARPVDAGWNFAPIVLIALVAYVAIYVRAVADLARARAERARRGSGRLALWLTGDRAAVRRADLAGRPPGEQLATLHMVQHLLLADLVPICLTLALTKHILRPVTRRIHRLERAAGPFGHPAFGVVAYVGAMWLWHIPALYEAALDHAFVHALEHLTFAAAGAPVLVAPALPDPLAAAARRPRPRALHGVDEDPGRLPRHPARVLAGSCSTTSTAPAARAGA